MQNKYYKRTELLYGWILQVLLIISSFLILYAHTIMEMIKNWSRDDNFSHGFLIPFVSAFMIWQKRDDLAQQNKVHDSWGIFIIFFAMLAHILGSISAETFSMRASIIICIVGITIYIWGFKVFMTIFIPTLYLFFMIPIPKILWNQISFPLQLLAAKLAAYTVHIFGMPVFREGNILHLKNTSLEVIDACSGLRSLTSLLALSAAYAFLSKLRLTNKWLLFLSAFPIAIIVNILRLTTTAFLATYIDPKTAHGFLHDLSGIVVFFVALLMLYIFSRTLKSVENRLN